MLLSTKHQFISLCATIFLMGFFQSSFAAVLQPISGRALNEDTILPADVFSRAQLIRDELNLIRLEMGKPEIQKAAVTVFSTAPRATYYLAKALFVKANRLALEQAQTSESEPVLESDGRIRPYHVWHMVNAVYERVLDVKKTLNINEKIKEQESDRNKTLGDVIQTLFLTDQVVAELLIRKISSSDVYQQVTTSIHIAAQLLAQFENVSRIPDAPTFERRKTPSDVYERLSANFALVKDIAKTSNKKMLDFSVTSNLGKTPNDVYELATLIVAELSYFHDFLPQAGKPAKAYFPGKKLPSHVFQRVGVLEQQLQALSRLTEENPHWLDK